MAKQVKIDEPGYKKLLDELRKSNPEKREAKEQKAIHKTLVRIVGDTKLHKAVREYGHPIIFAEGHSSSSSFNGYSHLEIDPEKGPLVVIRELDFMGDHFSETHNSRYPLYERKGKVFFSGEDDKEIDAAKAVRHEGVFGCNVDYSRAQTAYSITNSLEKAIASKLAAKTKTKH